MSLKIKLASTLAALTFAMPAFADILVTDSYARSSNPMAGAAFMVITNTGDTPDRLIGVSSDAAQRVQLHTHQEDDSGMMRMIHVQEGFVLPAGGDLVLKRGADHVMFMGLTAPFEQGATITVTLTFDQAGDIVVDIPVDQDRMPRADDHMDHDTDQDTDHGTDHDMDHGADHGSDG